MAKAAKRAGRKRKMGVKRHPGGKIIQPKPNEVGINARIRVHGMNRSQARTQEAGNALGEPLRGNEITQDQYNAAAEYMQARANYHKAILSLRMRSGSDFGGVGGFDSTDGTDAAYVARCKRDKEYYKTLRGAVLRSGSLSMMALESWIDYSDITLPLPWGCLGDFRLAANAIHRVVNNKRKAA
jgi:hypothetical protein